MPDPRAFLAQLFHVAVKAADPYHALAPYIAQLQPPKGRVVVIGAGKGSAQMAAALEKIWQEAGFGTLSGLVVTRYGYATRCEMIDVMEAAHPVPDENSLAAALRIKQTVSGLTSDDLVIALICGGGSALLVAPQEGITLDDKIALNQALLASGAPIWAMNAIRKPVSTIKGGKLARACAPARLVSFIVSDIPGDNPALVSSGPTVLEHFQQKWTPVLRGKMRKTQELERLTSPSETKTALEGGGMEEARAAIHHYNIDLPPRLAAFFADNREEQPTDFQYPNADNEVHIIASASRSLEAVKNFCRQNGQEAIILSDAIEGEARDIALMHAALAREVVLRHQPFRPPVILLSGGETTVTLKQGLRGSGGRNSEFALALALAMEGCEGITALAADTDGIDGASLHAGAFCDGHTAQKIRQLGLDPRGALAAHDSGNILAEVSESFTTGPTGTNVNDFRALLIEDCDGM